MMAPHCGIIRKGDPKITEELKNSRKKVEGNIDRVVDDNGKMSDTISGVAPGTTVDTYNQSRKRKREAAIGNWAAKIVGGAAGAGGAYAIYRGSKGKVKFLNADSKKTKALGLNVPAMSAEKKQGMALTAATGVGSTAGGYAGSRLHQEYVKRNPRYDYKEK